MAKKSNVHGNARQEARPEGAAQRGTRDIAKCKQNGDANSAWRSENAAALAAYAREVERDGLPLAAFRRF